MNAARAHLPHPSRSFWAHRPQEGFPPTVVRSPDLYDGSERLSISCTQTELPAKAQRDLLRLWCEALPGMSKVRYLWFHSKVPQELFEAACRIPRLEGLYVKWSSIYTLDPLAQPKHLKYVRIGSSPGIAGISCLAGLAHLRWLELDNLKLVSDLAPIETLTRLQGFGFTGAEGRRNTVASLAPVSKLLDLRWLHLGAMHVQDGSLRALATLKNLSWLGVGNFYPWSEFAWLSAQLPKTECTWFKPGDNLGRLGIKCKRCDTGIMLLSGKGKAKLCPSCDSAKWQAFSAAFEAAVADVTVGA